MLSPVRLSFGSRLTVAIIKLYSVVMLRRCSVWRIALSIWRENQCLSVWFIYDSIRLCLRVQPYPSECFYRLITDMDYVRLGFLSFRVRLPCSELSSCQVWSCIITCGIDSKISYIGSCISSLHGTVIIIGTTPKAI